MTPEKRLFIFGYGYSAAFLARKLLAEGWKLAATTRNLLKQQELTRLGIKAYDFNDTAIYSTIHEYPYLLNSVPPTKNGDSVLMAYGESLVQYRGKWVGFLSTTGVYGDHQGHWVDESTPPTLPLSSRRQSRLDAENAWLKLWHRSQVPVHIFRLAGIYGPGRSLGNRETLKESIVKEGHFFSRIHGEDIAGALAASMHQPHPGCIYNLADDEPSSRIEAATYGAQLLQMPAPRHIPYQPELLEGMEADFWKENKRVRNLRMKQELAYSLQYPTYREGLEAIYGVRYGEKVTSAAV